MFWTYLVPLYSGSKSKPSKKLAEAGGKLSKQQMEDPVLCRLNTPEWKCEGTNGRVPIVRGLTTESQCEQRK
jgi:hypothetical protein